MSIRPGHVIALFAPSGGAGRTSFALALSEAARKAGLSAVIVDVSHDADAARYAAQYGIDATIIDRTGAPALTPPESIVREVEVLRFVADIVIVDTPVGLAKRPLLESLSTSHDATLIGLSGVTMTELSGLLADLNHLAETGTPRDRLAYAFNKVEHDFGHERAIDAVRDAVFERAQCLGAIQRERKPVATLAPITAAAVLRRILLGLDRPARGSRGAA